VKHISVILFDDETKSIIEHESMPEGELLLNSVVHDGLIEILLEVNEIALEDKVYAIISRRFLMDKFRLVLVVKQKNK
jgi:hypothetical protein